MMDDSNGRNNQSVDYKLCILFNEQFGKCGPLTDNGQIKHGLTKISDLEKHTEEHLGERIENLIERNLDGSSLICEHHRYALGVDYKLCILFNEQFGKCGPFTGNRQIKHGLTKISDFNRSTEEHLKNLKFQIILNTWTEQDLIENRIGSSLDGLSRICEHHRYALGTSWRPSNKCVHPLHPPIKRGMKSCATTLAPMWLVNQVNADNPFSFVLGGRICRTHYAEESSKLNRSRRRKSDTPINAVLNDSINDSINDVDHDDDEQYQPDEISVPEEIQSSSSILGREITDILSISPIRFQINKSPVDELRPSTKRQLKRKLEQVKNESIRRVAESIAPNQSEELLESLFQSSDDEEEDVPADLVQLVQAYDDSDPQGKLIILSLVDHSKYTKSTIQRVFRCSRYNVDKARKIKSSTKGISIQPQKVIRRNRINTYKCEHFIEFLFSSGILQDVAYGVTKLKFDSGMEQTIPHAVLTTRYSHAIAFYLQLCAETEFQPLSESSLWRILRVLKPSQRTNLSGLDDITATGMNGFANLVKFLNDHKKGRELIDQLEAGKRYLKTVYQTRCSVESNIATHNSAFALSTFKEEPCLSVGDEVCSDCFSLISALESVLGIARHEGSEDDIYDVNAAINDVINYMKHQVRDFQQRQAKAYCFRSLSGVTVFWLKDFAQKILPLRHREGQREYFGKKGMTLHIDVFFREIDGKLLKSVYLTCIFRCKQSMIDVLNIGDHVLNEFRKDCPAVTQIYAKSDNAGGYHGNFMLEALFKMCRGKGLSLIRYDYNEPCKGKDQCDREGAGVKTLINSYVSSGQDLLSAEDVFDALHYGKGINNTKVSVLEIDADKSSLQGTEITNISLYHSALFYSSQMKLYRYFNIGPGNVVNYSDENKFVPSYTVKKEFSHTQEGKILSPRKTKTAKRRVDHSVCTLRFCPEPSCSDVFDSIEDFEKHMLAEDHTIPRQSTSMDRARASFVQKIKVSSQLHSTATPGTENIAHISMNEAMQTSTLMKHVAEQGWGLPQRVNFRYSFEQKDLLYKIFMDGETTGKKKSPEEVAIMIRKSLKPHQYVTSQQIRSLFSNFAKKLKEGRLKPPQPPQQNTQCKDIDEIEDEDEIIQPSKNKHKDKVAEKAENENDSTLERIEHTLQLDISKEANRVFSNLSEWNIEDYVAVQYQSQWFPGKICHIHQDGSADVVCMKYVDLLQRENKFRWPTRSEGNEDKLTYEREDLMLKLNEPQLVGKNKRLQCFQLDEQDFTDASDILRMVLSCR